MTNKVYNQFIPNSTRNNCFEKIETEEQAYWLGFLYADGYVAYQDWSNQIELTLQERDYHHLEKFRNFIGNKNVLQYRQKQKAYRYSFKSKQIKENLISLGCTPRKSLTLTFPTKEQVPDNLLRHFIRGYVDGDGCLTVYSRKNSMRIEILGTMEFLSGLQKRCNLFQCRIYAKPPTKIYRIMLGKQTTVKIICDWLYKDASIYLNRKYQKYYDYYYNAVQ